MKRKYKEDLPLNTINKIRSIITDLDMFTYESFWGNPYENIYSVRVETDEDAGNFGTNGKGRTRCFALASAYAEFIERLQNNYLTGINSLNRFHLNSIKHSTDLFYYPDEVVLTKEEFYKLPKDFLNDILSGENKDYVEQFFSKLEKNNYKGVLAVPFYNVKDNIINYLPFNLLNSFTGSNGMAAGNTMYEGVYQGLCELLERYAVSLIYHEQLTPPTIERNFLRQFPNEYRIIEDIEGSGDYQIIVKDFSANKKIPAVGVIIKYQKEQKYKLNVGCDTSFPIALSRALTEIYQGYKTNQDFNNHLLNIPKKEHEYFINNDIKSTEKRQKALSQYIINGGGVFPFSLFRENSSYVFDKNIFKTEMSYKEEVKKLIYFFIDNGYNVYIRNVSFLKFPAFYIYIPIISGWGKKDKVGDNLNLSLKAYIESDYIEDILFPFKEISIKK